MVVEARKRGVNAGASLQGLFLSQGSPLTAH